MSLVIVRSETDLPRPRLHCILHARHNVENPGSRFIIRLEACSYSILTALSSCRRWLYQAPQPGLAATFATAALCFRNHYFLPAPCRLSGHLYTVTRMMLPRGIARRPALPSSGSELSTSTRHTDMSMFTCISFDRGILPHQNQFAATDLTLDAQRVVL